MLKVSRSVSDRTSFCRMNPLHGCQAGRRTRCVLRRHTVWVLNRPKYVFPEGGQVGMDVLLSGARAQKVLGGWRGPWQCCPRIKILPWVFSTGACLGLAGHHHFWREHPKKPLSFSRGVCLGVGNQTSFGGEHAPKKGLFIWGQEFAASTIWRIPCTRNPPGSLLSHVQIMH